MVFVPFCGPIILGSVLKKDKNAQPERDKWIEFRTNSTTEIYRLISEEIARENPGCHLRLNDVFSWPGGEARDVGLDLQAVAPYLGSVVNQDHQEQLGIENETFENRKKWLVRNRQLIGPDKHYVSGIATRMANGLVLKHYDGASFSLMRAFKQGMIDAGVVGLTPCIGKEVEEMDLENYKPFREELVEEWGVETDGTGIAKYAFNEQTDKYDIRITYFDQADGQSEVFLFIAGQEKASFRLDEDTDCWRWRRFENIRVKRGDEIKLVGKAHNGENAKLDFIEFIPRR